MKGSLFFQKYWKVGSSGGVGMSGGLGSIAYAGVLSVNVKVFDTDTNLSSLGYVALSSDLLRKVRVFLFFLPLTKLKILFGFHQFFH